MANDMQHRRTTVWTVGHSTHPYEGLIELLRAAQITAIADVRSAPFSRHFPQFNKEPLQAELRSDGIAYSFLGKELGGRPSGREYYEDGVASYERMAEARTFKAGLRRVLDGAQKYRIALMCSERDPLDCHRCLLVGRALSLQGVTMKHILSDGTIMDQKAIEERLLKSEGQHGGDLFLSPDDLLAEAYRKRARRVAYSDQSNSLPENGAAR